MKTDFYPNILILGNNHFDLRSGGGITMTNLFKGWDKAKLAVAVEKIDSLDFEICEKYYHLGVSECKQRFPFSLRPQIGLPKSGVVRMIENGSLTDSKAFENEVSFLNRIHYKFMEYTGLVHFKYKYSFSDEFHNWIMENSPDVLYSMLSSRKLIRFVDELSKKMDIPIAIHMMDDWPKTITKGQKGVFRVIWNCIIDKELRHLLDRSSLLLSISEAMSEEFKLRYGKKFIPFHNPVEIETWMPDREKDYSSGEKFVLLYAGRIGTGIQNSLLETAVAVQSLVDKGINIEFHIQATNNAPILHGLEKFTCVRLRKPVSYNELPQVFFLADLLLLPNDFDDISVSFLKYSMPTKASEYMISGTPVLVYSSLETAVTKHALKHGWAYVVGEHSNERLETAISNLYHDMELRGAIGSKAKEFARTHYDSGKIRQKFRDSFNIFLD